MWHSPLAEQKHALAKQCGLDLAFPCIIVKMFVSAIVSLLLLGTAALLCFLIEESRVSPCPHHLRSRESKAGPLSRSSSWAHTVLYLASSYHKGSRKCRSAAKNSSKINIANRNEVWLHPLAVLLDLDRELTWGSNPPHSGAAFWQFSSIRHDILWARIGAGSLLLIKRMFNISLEFLKWKDVTLSIPASTPSPTEVSFHIQIYKSAGVPPGSLGASQRPCCAPRVCAAWLRQLDVLRRAYKTRLWDYTEQQALTHLSEQGLQR